MSDKLYLNQANEVEILYFYGNCLLRKEESGRNTNDAGWAIAIRSAHRIEESPNSTGQGAG